MMKIEDGKTVILDYTLALADGRVIDSTQDDGPFTYIQGSGEILDGLEQELNGLEKGTKKEFTLAAFHAFGEHDPEALREIHKNELPSQVHVAGTRFQGNGPQGKILNGRVVEVRENTLLVDFNHPYAGEQLCCSVHILDVR
ncbi:MAG: FKBP-type peptidyl-prolyl cis-trans isomerase [Candidatus Electrothrix sp. YB6]